MQSRVLIVALGAAVLLAALPTLAEDVVVKNITPDNPQTQPDESAKPAPAKPTPTRPVMRRYQPLGGDWMIHSALMQAKVTDEQKAQLKDVLDELAAQAKADQEKAVEAMKKARETAKAAKASGDKDPTKDPEVIAAADEVKKLWDDNSKAAAERRQRLLASLDGVLSPEQIQTVSDTFDRFSPDEATRNRPLAKGWVRSSLPGVEITDAQEKELVAAAAPIQEKYGQQWSELQKARQKRMQELYKENPKDWQGNWKKVNEEFGPRTEALKVEMSKALNEAIESKLTDQQKQQMAAGRQEAWKKSVLQWVDATVNSFERVKLTDEQKAKVKELADAAGDAMLKTDMYDNAGRAELARNLREDIKKLLTDEQKKMVR